MRSLSVVVPTYLNDEPEELEASLRSVLDQTFPPEEVIIVGDGPLSSDLEDVLEQFQQNHPDVISVIILPENRGKGKARQVGVEKASNEFVAMMDADDVCREYRFEKQLQFLDRNSRVDVVGSYATEFDPESGDQYAVRIVPEDHEEIARMARFRSPINQATVMFRRDTILNSGNYEDVRTLEDYRLWARLLTDGAIFANIPESLVRVRAGRKMHERRGGWAYARSEIRMQYDFYRWGFIPLWLAAINTIIRVAVRFLPNRLRGLLYAGLLREDPNREEANHPDSQR